MCQWGGTISRPTLSHKLRLDYIYARNTSKRTLTTHERRTYSIAPDDLTFWIHHDQITRLHAAKMDAQRVHPEGPVQFRVADTNMTTHPLHVPAAPKEAEHRCHVLELPSALLGGVLELGDAGKSDLLRNRLGERLVVPHRTSRGRNEGRRRHNGDEVLAR